MAAKAWAALLLGLLAAGQTTGSGEAATVPNASTDSTAAAWLGETGDRLAPAAESLLAIPADLRDLLRERVGRAGERSQRLLLDALARFLFEADGLSMRYRPDASHSVSQAFETREANCLGFTLLSIALARELGLEAYGQEVEGGISWRREGETVFRTQHINAGVRAGGERFSIDVASNEVIALAPPKTIGDSRLLAHYYNNRLAELLAAGALEAAAAHARIGLRLDPANAALISNIGVLRNRQGRVAEAEAAWLQALDIDPGHAAALTNLSSLYGRQGDASRAARFEQRLRAVQAQDPFHQFMLGLQFEAQGDWRRAAQRFRRAIRLHPHEHRFHFGLARAYLADGADARAARALQHAQQLSDGDTRGAYAAKLEALRGETPK
jgi:tetratricopeptide (TPR) repeat protein